MAQLAARHLAAIKINDEYGTPHRIFERACSDYHVRPLIDICASEHNHVLPLYYTKKENCLYHNIDMDFFMNPPYSEIEKFMRFAFMQHKKNNVDALILTFAKTDTNFWHKYVEDKAEVHFIKGRLQFNDEHGHPKKIYNKKLNRLVNGSAPYPSCWIIYRKVKNDR